MRLLLGIRLGSEQVRFDEADIRRLLTAKWWNWPVEKITEHAVIIMSGTPKDLT